MVTFFCRRIPYLFWCFVLFYIIIASSAASETKNSFCPITPDIGSAVYMQEFEHKKRVYLVQDAHCQPDAQYNIAHLIEQIRAHHKDIVVGLEGAASTIDVSNFRSFPARKSLLNVAEYFIEKGIISGSEYGLITHDVPFYLAGIEQAELYRSNHQVMNESLRIQNAAAEQLDRMRSALDRIITSRLRQDQQIFIAQWEQFYRHKIDLKQYLEYLSAIDTAVLGERYPSLSAFAHVLNAEQNIDFNRVEQQRLAFLDHISNVADKAAISDMFKLDIQYKLHKTTPLEYFTRLAEWMAEYKADQSSAYKDFTVYVALLQQSAGIDKAVLKTEIFSAVAHCAKKMFEHRDDYLVFDCARNTVFLADMMALQMDSDTQTQSDYSGLLTTVKQQYSVFFDNRLPENIQWDVLEHTYDLARQFYEIASQRDRAMLDNLLSEMERKNYSTGIIIAGGFHRRGIQAECAQRGINICVIEPTIQKINHDTPYFSLVRNYRSPIERWIARSTLALASWLAAEPLVDAGVKPIRTQIFSSLLTASYTRALTESEITQITENLDGITIRANAYLAGWLSENAPLVRVNNIEQIGNKLAVTLAVDQKRLVYLFTRKGLSDQVPVPRDGLLEQGQVGTDIVEAVTDTVIDRIKMLAQNTRISGEYASSFADVSQTLEILGINPDDLDTTITLPLLINKYNDFVTGSRSFERISLADFFDAVQYVIAEYEPQVNSQELARYLGVNLDDKAAATLNPADLIKESFELFRRSNEGDTPVDVESMRTPWKYVLQARGIQTLVFDPQMPFEAVANTLFLLAFSQEIQADKYLLDQVEGDLYQAQIIKLADNSFVARTSIGYNSIVSNFYPSFEAQVPTTVRGIPLRNGIMSLQMDGAITFSSVQTFGAAFNQLDAPPVLSASANSLVRGETGMRQMQKFIAEMRAAALKKGVIIRGIAFQNQQGEPRFFPDTESFFAYYQQLVSSKYVPPVQSDWATSAGSMSFADFSQYYVHNNIRLSDVTGGARLFAKLKNHTSFRDKRFLDVGSQIGQNVLYAYLHEPVYAVGVDFNPYNIRIAREMSAYVTEHEDIPSAQLPKSMYEYLLEEGGNERGQLFFRTSLVKHHEQQTGKKIAKKPSERLEFAVADARTLPYPDNSFDITNTLHLLEYIDGASAALKEMIRVTAPGGYIQFNYGIRSETNVELIQEAIRLLEVERGITVSYEVVEESASIGAVMTAVIIRIVDKAPVQDVERHKQLLLFHGQKATPLPNFFDEKPYLESILAPIDIMPESMRVVESLPISQLDQSTQLSSAQKFNLLFAQELIAKTYGTAAFNGIKTLQIERGDLTLFSFEPGVIRVHQLALNDPMLLAAQMMHAIFRVRGNAVPDEFFVSDGISSQDMPLYKELALWLQTIAFMRDNFGVEQLNRIITVLTGSVNRDTALEKEAYEFAHILERSITESLSDEAVMSSIADAFSALPQYQNFNAIQQLASDGEGRGESVEFIQTALGVAQRLLLLNQQDVRGPPYFPSVTLDIAALGAAARNPDKTIPALAAFLPRYAQFQKSSQSIPGNIAELLEEENMQDILSLYPNAGLYILSDIFKTLTNDPADPAEAPFFRDLEASALLAIMENLERQLSLNFQDAQRPLSEMIPLLKATPTSAFIGPRLNAALIERNNGRAYGSLTINLRNDELFDEFEERLENQLALNNLQDDDMIVLRVNKTYPSETDQNGNLHIEIVADTVQNIREQAEEIIMNKNFGKFELVYGKNFLPEENMIDGDGISFSDEMKRVTGLGSEIFRSDAQLFMQLGAQRTPIDTSSHQIRVFYMTEQHYEADFSETHFMQLGLEEPENRQKFYNVLYRLGILDTSVYRELSEQQLRRFEINARIYPALIDALQGSEGFLQMLNRKIQEWTTAKARLNRILDFYASVGENPELLSAMPSLAAEYDEVKTMMYSVEPSADNLDSALLMQEQELLQRINQFENAIKSYFKNDTEGLLRAYQDVLIPSSDTRSTFSQMADYIDALLPLIPLFGAVPEKVQPQNSPNIFGTILKVAEHTANTVGSQHTARLLTADAVLPTLVNELAGHETVADRSNPRGYQAWEQFMPYYRKMLASGNPMLDVVRDILSGEYYQKIYDQFPETGFYLLTELVKFVTDDPADPSEFSYLAELTAQEIFSLIESFDARAQKKVSGQFSAISSGMYEMKNLPARTWIGPQLHHTLHSMNAGKDYKEINLTIYDGITTVEDAQELFAKFVQAVKEQNIQEDDIIVLRISDTSHVDDETDIAVTIVADRLRNLNTSAPITRIAQGNSFGEHLFSFRTHFLPDNFITGDSPLRSIHEGDRSNGESGISLSDELRAVGGIGSELMRTHTAIMHLLEVGGARVNSTIHGLGMMGILDGQFDSKFTSNLYTDEIAWDAAGFRRYKNLLYRLGLIDERTYSEFEQHKDDLEYLKRLSTNIVDSNRDGTESNLQLLRRKSTDLQMQIAELNNLAAVYQAFSSDPAVRAAFPRLDDDFLAVKTYIDLQSIDGKSFLDKLSNLQFERELLSELIVYFRRLEDYLDANPDGVLEPHRDLIEAPLDLNEAFFQVNTFFEQQFPFTEAQGGVPLEIRPENISLAARFPLTYAKPLSDVYSPVQIKEMLVDENPVKAIENGLYTLQIAQDLRQEFAFIAQVIADETIPELIEYYFDQFIDRLAASVAKPIERMLENKGNPYEALYSNFQGALGLLSYSAMGLLINPDETQLVIDRIQQLNRAQFTLLLQYAAENPQTFATGVTDFLDMIESGALDAILRLKPTAAVYGRIPALTALNGTTIPGEGVESIIEFDPTKISPDNTVAQRSLLHIALEMQRVLANSGITAQIIKGQRSGIESDEYYLRVGGVSIGVAPYSADFSVSLRNEIPVDSTQIDAVSAVSSNLPLYNEPLFWQPSAGRDGILVSGGIEIEEDSTKYNMVLTFSVAEIADGTVNGSLTYRAVVNRDDIARFYYALQSRPPEQAIETLNSSAFKQSYFGFQESIGIFEHDDNGHQLLNQALYRIILSIDPLWAHAEKTTKLERKLSRLVAGTAELTTIPVSELGENAQQVFKEVQMDVQLSLSASGQIKLPFSNLENARVVIFQDSIIGWLDELDGTDRLTLHPSVGPDAAQIIRQRLLDSESAFSPLVKTQNSVTGTVPLLTLSLGESAVEWIVEFAPGIDEAAVNTARYTTAIENALRALPIEQPKKHLKAEKTVIKLVDGHWRLGSRQPPQPDGTVVVELDIDAFRDAKLLEFVLRHELEPHNETNPEAAFASEIIAVVNDVYYFRSMPAQDRKHLLASLRREQVDQHQFAALLEKNLTAEIDAIYKTVVGYVGNPAIYPRFAENIRGRNNTEIAELIAQNSFPEFAEELRILGLSELSVAALVIHPQAVNIMLGLDLLGFLESTEKEAGDIAAQLPIAVLNGSQEGLADLITLFYRSYDKKEANTAKRASYWQDWAQLLALYGVEAVPLLLEAAQQVPDGIVKLQDIMLDINRELGYRAYAGFEGKGGDEILRTAFEDGQNNVIRTYSLQGELLSEESYEILSYDAQLRQLIIDETLLTEKLFDEKLQRMLELTDQLVILDKEGDEKNIDTMRPLLSEVVALGGELSKLYNTYPRLSSPHVALHLQEDTLAIIRQYVSDLIGSPLTSVYGQLQLAEMFLQPGSDIAQSLETALEGIKIIRENFVRFRMIDEYHITVDTDEPMIILPKTLADERNLPYVGINFRENDELLASIREQVEEAQDSDVFVVYFDGDNPAALAWITQALEELAQNPAGQLAVFSSELDTDVVEGILEQSGVPLDNVVVLGRELRGDADATVPNMLELISSHFSAKPENLIFLTGETQGFAELIRSGVQVLPLPDIQQLPAYLPKRILSYDVFEEAA